jgi:alkylation response protein AidB-like acyl-CoA dehydrogenase
MFSSQIWRRPSDHALIRSRSNRPHKVSGGRNGMKLELLISPEQQLFRETVRRFAEKEVAPRAAEVDRSGEFPRDLYERMADLGLLGLVLPTDAGGAGGDMVSQALAQEQLARASATMANAQVTPVEEGLSIFRHAPPDVRDRYLPGIIRGKIIPSFALTEPGAGSDAASIQMTAVRDTDNGGWVLNGTKQYVTMAALADVTIVVARTNPDLGPRGISMFLVDTSLDGVSVGRREDLLGVRGLGTASMHFAGVHVSAECLMGEEGRGLHQSLSTIDLGRISTAAMATGIAQAAFEAALAYTQQRVQFGQPIFQFQAVQFKLAEISAKIDACRLMYLHAAAAADSGGRMVLESSEAKLFATDVAGWVTDEALQLFGGYGFSRDFPAERYLRDAKVCQIYEGTNNIQRLVIARELTRTSA